MSDRLLNRKEVDKAWGNFISPNVSNLEKLIENTYQRIERIAQAQRRKTLKAVGEWLDKHAAFFANVPPSQKKLPFLNGVDYEELYEALKRGEFPNNIKGE